MNSKIEQKHTKQVAVSVVELLNEERKRQKENGKEQASSFPHISVDWICRFILSRGICFDHMDVKLNGVTKILKIYGLSDLCDGFEHHDWLTLKGVLLGLGGWRQTQEISRLVFQHDDTDPLGLWGWSK